MDNLAKARALSSRTGRQIMIKLFYTTLISVDLAQYEIFRYKVCDACQRWFTVKILKFGTPQTIAIIVLKIEKLAVTLH